MGDVVSKKRPSREEMDERVTVPIPADKLVEGVLNAGPHPDEEEDEGR